MSESMSESMSEPMSESMSESMSGRRSPLAAGAAGRWGRLATGVTHCAANRISPSRHSHPLPWHPSPRPWRLARSADGAGRAGWPVTQCCCAVNRVRLHTVQCVRSHTVQQTIAPYCTVCAVSRGCIAPSNTLETPASPSPASESTIVMELLYRPVPYP
jgi:hypothetical protein